MGAAGSGLPANLSGTPVTPRFGSVHGEELAYVLGMPLVGGTYHFVQNYTDQVAISYPGYFLS